MALWWQPGDDTTGLVSRSERVVGTMRDLLGDEAQELYLLSSKLIAKEPEEGGAFAWHQVPAASRSPSSAELFCRISGYNPRAMHGHLSKPRRGLFRFISLLSGLWIFLRKRCFVPRLRLCEPGLTPVSQASSAINYNIRPQPSAHT